MRVLPTYLPTYLLLASTFIAALTFAAPASACQLVCAITKAYYPGDLAGGLPAGADAKCAAEYPGFKFLKSSTMLSSVPGLSTQDGITSFMQYTAPVRAAHVPGNGANSNGYNCLNYTTSSAGVQATNLYLLSQSGMRFFSYQLEGCDIPRPLVCCNM